MTFNLYLKGRGSRDRLPRGLDAVIHLDEPGTAGYPVHHNLQQLPLLHPPGPEVQAFLALGVWAADKLLPREEAPDAWTRSITLHLPGTPVWGKLAPRLTRLVNFLTDDQWTLKLREAPPGLSFGGKWPPGWQPQAVVLFSGGLDSLVGALDLLEGGQRLLLVSHYDFGQLAGVQQDLAGALVSHYGSERVAHLGLRVQFPETREFSLRSRSLLYLALGLTAAAALGEEVPLVVAENGWMSLNPPLTPNRLGSYSTRTTHPHFLERLAALWGDAGLHHQLHNPYQSLTKGEVLSRCRNRNLLQRLYPRTVSCARPVVSRWQRGPAGACGYCYPCLLRRAALHLLGWDRGEDYRLDVLAGPDHLRHRVRGRDLRAVLAALRTWETDPQDLAARLWLGETPEEVAARYGPAQELLAAGMGEIGGFFRDRGPQCLKAYLGW
jgi:7-cyano-7-deazaguanine synthase in queuosine biosynthesis